MPTERENLTTPTKPRKKLEPAITNEEFESAQREIKKQREAENPTAVRYARLVESTREKYEKAANSYRRRRKGKMTLYEKLVADF
jgi:hypothetical protein